MRDPHNEMDPQRSKIKMEAEPESSKAIQLWILEHACKRKMGRVIDEITEKRKDDPTFLENQSDSIVPLFSQDSVHLAVLLHNLNRAVSRLESVVSSERPLRCDFDDQLSARTLWLLEKMFSEHHFLPVKLFVNLLARVRLLELICRMVNEEDKMIIWAQMDIYFPRSNASLKNNLQKMYKIDNPLALEKMMSAFMCCRKYVVHFMVMKEARKKEYLANTLPKDLADFARSALKYLGKAQDAVAKRLPPSPLEQGASEDLKYSDDCLIQVLLGNLSPGITEESLLYLLKQLENTPKQVQAFFTPSDQGDRTPVAEETKPSDEVPVSSPPVSTALGMKKNPQSLSTDGLKNGVAKERDGATATPLPPSAKKKRRNSEADDDCDFIVKRSDRVHADRLKATSVVAPAAKRRGRITGADGSRSLPSASPAAKRRGGIMVADGTKAPLTERSMPRWKILNRGETTQSFAEQMEELGISPKVEKDQNPSPLVVSRVKTKKIGRNLSSEYSTLSEETDESIEIIGSEAKEPARATFKRNVSNDETKSDEMTLFVSIDQEQTEPNASRVVVKARTMKISTRVSAEEDAAKESDDPEEIATGRMSIPATGIKIDEKKLFNHPSTGRTPTKPRSQCRVSLHFVRVLPHNGATYRIFS